jgi:hypothetical protein
MSLLSALIPAWNLLCTIISSASKIPTNSAHWKTTQTTERKLWKTVPSLERTALGNPSQSTRNSSRLCFLWHPSNLGIIIIHVSFMGYWMWTWLSALTKVTQLVTWRWAIQKVSIKFQSYFKYLLLLLVILTMLFIITANKQWLWS